MKIDKSEIVQDCDYCTYCDSCPLFKKLKIESDHIESNHEDYKLVKSDHIESNHEDYKWMENCIKYIVIFAVTFNIWYVIFSICF